MPSFELGSFSVKEILYGVMEDLNGKLLCSLDQLQSATIEITSDPFEVKDRRGDTIVTTYKNKIGTFTATNTLMHVELLNFKHGGGIKRASAQNKIQMPKIEIVSAGSIIQIDEYVEGTLQVMEYGVNGYNGKKLIQSTDASYEDGTYGINDNIVMLPAVDERSCNQYLIKYERSKDSGIVLSNSVNTFPQTVKLTLFVSIIDPCRECEVPAYLVIPRFKPDPNLTINLDIENQTIDLTGTMHKDYCGCDGGNLYHIYIPDECVEDKSSIVDIFDAMWDNTWLGAMRDTWGGYAQNNTDWNNIGGASLV